MDEGPGAAADFGEQAEVGLRELADGIRFWRSRRGWPADFHNSDYEQWERENPRGQFSLEWWRPFLKQLQAWIATRPVSGSELTARFEKVIPELTEAWHSACAPRLGADITTVSWDDVAAFPAVVGQIKPTIRPSTVFTSKFCHFLLPRVFPVVDNEGLGDAWPTYERYFRFVQQEWAGTPEEVRAALAAELQRQIEAAGASIFDGFPTVNKIVELRLIGRRHPSASRLGPAARW